uniref:Ciliary neurotrophic factor n=1 Tax=Poecilia reticulata TaxID=8081 RepID=A0A3P9NDC2_POERE
MYIILILFFIFLVLVLMLLGNHWSFVLPAPTEHRCSFESNADLKCSSKNTLNLTNLLVHETNEALREYVSTSKNNPCSPQVPDEVPSTTVAGSNMIEKLQDIYAKNELFSLHLSEVERYQKELFATASILGPFLKASSALKTRLKHLLTKVECHIKSNDPLTPVPTSPPPLSLPHKYSYEKKVYGCAVIVRLKDWGQNVKEVVKSMCSRNVVRSRS